LFNFFAASIQYGNGYQKYVTKIFPAAKTVISGYVIWITESFWKKGHYNAWIRHCEFSAILSLSNLAGPSGSAFFFASFSQRGQKNAGLYKKARL